MVTNPTVLESFINFINQSPTPFHAVSNAIKRLESVGFIRLRERDDWRNRLRKGGKYYITRNQSSIVAFAVGGNYQPGNGLAIVGCHTDSPCFKVRPISKKTHQGYLQVGVETYGGGIWPTWFDRDLGIAGRVIVKDSDGPNYSSHLVHIQRPILRFPTLAIHLDRTQSDQIKCNLESQMVPILALVNDKLNKLVKSDDKDRPVQTPSALSITQDYHHPLLLSILAQSLSSSVQGQNKIREEDIHDLELSLFDTNPSTVGGGLGEFIFSPRLDNLFSSFAAFEALAQSVEGKEHSKGLENSSSIRTIALWDNEEIGSVSFQGAESNFLEAILTRVSSSFSERPSPAITEQTLAASFLLSCDMGHAIHPCYPEKHEENHRPIINKGPAIKTNAKQRYARYLKLLIF
ncbi:peptidase M18 [Phakopsora pachyrhizi]|nr:peptidase M18 [Phakopsora pachyrhizi]